MVKNVEKSYLQKKVKNSRNIIFDHSKFCRYVCEYVIEKMKKNSENCYHLKCASKNTKRDTIYLI